MQSKNLYAHVKFEIKRHGKDYSFFRQTKDAYGSLSGNDAHVKDVKALFHQSKTYASDKNNITTETLATVSKPMLLILAENAQELEKDDYFTVGAKTYVITDINDLENLGVVFDISLRQVLE